jgi:hypothetical protein
VVPIPEAEPVVGRWRSTLDPSAAYGVPAHVTVMYPFLPLDTVDREALAELFAGYAAFDVVLARCARLPGLGVTGEVGERCPRVFGTICGSTPAASISEAALCRRSWSRTGGRSCLSADGSAWSRSG